MVCRFDTCFYHCPLPLDKVECLWSNWSEWTSCSKTCGGGVKEKSRKVQIPAQNGGSPCRSESARQTESCNEQDCPGKYFYLKILKEKCSSLNQWCQTSALAPTIFLLCPEKSSG